MPAADHAPQKPRLIWIDTARGIGIILVVYAHVLRGQVAAKMLAATPAEQWQDRVIYAFHMPFFFLLSGLFAGYASSSRLVTVRRRLVTIVYPYLLWSTVQVLLNVAAHQYVNRPQPISSLFQIALVPIGQFWFLYVLAILQLLALLPRRVFYLTVPIGLLATLEWGSSTIFTRAGWFLPFFAFGLYLGPRGLEAWVRSPRRALICLIAGTALFLLLIFPVQLLAGKARMLADFGPAIAGIVAMLGLARLIDDRTRLLPMLGVASLAIFVLHVICGAAVRAGLAHMHLAEPALAVAAVSLGGLLIPLAIYQVSARLGITPWLGLGFAPASPARMTANVGLPAEAS